MLRYNQHQSQQKGQNDEVNYDGVNLLIDLKRLRQRPKQSEYSYGVTWVVEVKDSMKSLCEKASSLGCVQKGTFRCDFLAYKPAPGVSTSIGQLSVFHHTHFPATTFLIGGSDDKLIKATADRGFDLLLPKFKAGYVADSSGYYENNGLVYHYHDFRIRIGTASQNKSITKGTIVEIEYLPATHMRTARPILMKFAEVLLGDAKKRNPANPPWHNNKEIVFFNVSDIFKQYYTLFTNMRKRVGSVVYDTSQGKA